MKSRDKTFLIVIGSLITLCLCLGAASFVAIQGTEWTLAAALESDPANVTTVGNSIAAYTLPDGFDDGYAVR